MADGTEKLPRGIRNKNPGNIKLGTDWDGLASEQSDPVFCVFNESVWGIRALMRILLVYRFNPMDKLENSMKDYLPLVKSIIRMENGQQPFTDELLVEGMYRAWDGYETNSSAS